MSKTQRPNPDRSAAQTASSKGAAGFPAKRNAYLRPQLTRTDLRKALSDVGTADDGINAYGKYAS